MKIQHAALLGLSKPSGTIFKEIHKILRAPRVRPAPRPGAANRMKIRHSAFLGPANLMKIQNAALLGLSKRSGAVPKEIRMLLRAPSMRPAPHVKHTCNLAFPVSAICAPQQAGAEHAAGSKHARYT